MPPRTRKTTSPPDEAPQACPLCFPAGFPPGAASLGCEHGTWAAADTPAGDGTQQSDDSTETPAE